MVGLTDDELEQRLRTVLAERMPGVVTAEQASATTLDGFDPITDGSPRHAGSTHPRQRRRALIVVAAAAVVATALGVAVINARHLTVTTSTISPATSTLPAENAGQSETVLAPVGLPDGWKVWRVSRVSHRVAAGARQLFGAFDASGQFVGVYVTITDTPPTVGPGPERTVRNQSAALYDGNVPSLTWSENGRWVEAQTKGVTLDDTIAFLDALTWRSDPNLGFEPSSASTRQLYSEEVNAAPAAELQTYYGIVPSNGPTFTADTPKVADDERTITVTQPATPGRIDPQAAFSGSLQPDGSVITGDPVGLVLTDGTQVLAEPVDSTDEQLALVRSVQPTPTATLQQLILDESSSLQALPEISTGVAGVGQIIIRGDNPSSPDALCLVVAGTERCRPYLPVSITTNLGFVASISVDGHWFMFGHSNAPTAAVGLVEWTPGIQPTVDHTTQSVITPTATEADGQRWWVSELPDHGPNDITIYDTATNQLDHTASEYGFHRNDWS